MSVNDVTFELSEAVSGYPNRNAIAEKVNRLIDIGARVALDDVGAGRDGLERLYTIRSATVVKIDRGRRGDGRNACLCPGGQRRPGAWLVGRFARRDEPDR